MLRKIKPFNDKITASILIQKCSCILVPILLIHLYPHSSFVIISLYAFRSRVDRLLTHLLHSSEQTEQTGDAVCVSSRGRGGADVKLIHEATKQMSTKA
jgi:hypothetical protein